MGTIILLLFIFFIVIPLVKALWRGWQFHRRWKEATAGMRDAFERAQGRGHRPDDTQPPAKRKKIDPSVGEYVAFEEIHVDTTATASHSADGTTRVHVESQVEDAVWEEIR